MPTNLRRHNKHRGVLYCISTILVFASVSSIITPAYAIPPLEQFVFQGVLKDSSGNLITGTKNIGLRLYTVSSGHTATNDATCVHPFCLWTENQTSVSVSNGVFTIYAGSINSLTKVMNFTNALYMEVIIQGSPDQVLSPRISIAAVPFALAAEKASTNFNLNKYEIINASNIYGSGIINGITINNSTQAVSGISSLQIQEGSSVISTINNTGGINGSSITVQKSGSLIASISKAGVVNGSSVQAQNNGIINAILSTSGLTIKSTGGSTVGGINNIGTVNGSSVQVQNGGIIVGSINSTGGISATGLKVLSSSGSNVGSISKTGVVNGSSLTILNGGTTEGSITNTGVLTVLGAISAPTSINTINGIIINSGVITGVSTLTTSGIITSGGNLTANNGIIIAAGHIRTTGPQPTLSGTGCGTLSGTDNAGSFTSTGTPTTCTVTFKSRYTTAPICVGGGADSGGFPIIVSAVSATAVSFIDQGGTFNTGVLVSYICMSK